MPWPMRGLRDGVLTTGWPSHPDAYADEFAAAVAVRRHIPATATAGRHLIDAVSDCPTGAISGGHGVPARVDRGRCILCGRCVALAPETFAWARGPEAATLDRAALVVPTIAEDDRTLRLLRAGLRRRVRRLRRSVHIRHVDTGSDGSDEWEVQALLNPVYDMNRLGIFLTASPRHADILLVTGIGGDAMSAALARTRQAMPDPVVVIVAGADAISGGLFGGGYASAGGAAAQLPVDVWIPGSPASPFSLLYGILLGLGRVADPASTRPRGVR